MGINIEGIDTSTAPDALLVDLAHYYDVIEAEDLPGDSPVPVDMRIADWRTVVERFPVYRWVLRQDDEIVAVSVVTYDREENLENGFGRVHVHPEMRRRGYARALAAPMFDHLQEAGRTRFDTWIKEGDPAEELASRIGLKSVYVDKRSRLIVSELDMALMRSWIERARERAADYSLTYYEVPLPEDVVQKFCDLTLIMNTAPREDYQADDETLTPETWREIEATILQSKSQLHTLIAVHEPTGEFAGYTQVKTQDLQPDLAWQWDTGVHPDHRNKGLGRWLKAAMIERIVSSYPAVERVDTFNAGSNAPMLHINVTMGFRPVHVSHAWQGDLVTARERLGV